VISAKIFVHIHEARISWFNPTRSRSAELDRSEIEDILSLE
jgi:hypothetical protein